MKTNSTIKLRSCVAVFAMTYLACISCSINSEASGNDAAEITQTYAGSQQVNAVALPPDCLHQAKRK